MLGRPDGGCRLLDQEHGCPLQQGFYQSLTWRRTRLHWSCAGWSGCLPHSGLQQMCDLMLKHKDLPMTNDIDFDYYDIKLVTWWWHVFLVAERITWSFWEEGWCSSHWGDFLCVTTMELDRNMKLHMNWTHNSCTGKSLKTIHASHTSYWFGAGVFCCGACRFTATGSLNTRDGPVLKSKQFMKELCKLYTFGPGNHLCGSL